MVSIVTAVKTLYLIFLLLLLRRIRPCGVFPLRINSEIVNLTDSCRAPWTGHQPDARPLPTQENTNTQQS
jgi:hypothetical protein